jgi:site-specific recombinase XerD
MGKKEQKTRGVFEKVPGSGVWWIHYTDAEGQRRREKAGRKSDAIKLYQQRKSDATAGVKIKKPLRERSKTFRELAALGLAFARKYKSNPDDDEQKIRTLLAEFGDQRADSLTQQKFTLFLDARETSEGTGPATFNRYRAQISMIYREAIRVGWVDHNPARLIKSRKEPGGRIRYLTPDEDTRLQRVIDDKFPKFKDEFVLAVHTGMRRSEQFSAEWPYIDSITNKINLPKTKNGDPRSIPLNADVVAALERLHERTGHQRRIFLTTDGKPFIKKALRHWFDEAIELAGIDDFSWHDLRHTFCSRLVMAGVALKTVQELMGHKTIQMTARYAHLAPGHLQAAVDLIATQNRHQTAARTVELKSSQPTATRTATSTILDEKET